MAMTHDEAQWLVDALISVTTLCVRCEERGLKELQADADEVYDHIRDYVISALEDKPMMIYRSGAFVSDSDEWGRVRTVPCAGGDV